MEKWQIESNIEVHGHFVAARILRKRGVPFALAYSLIFDKAPRIL
jgi:hypothetical protein